MSMLLRTLEESHHPTEMDDMKAEGWHRGFFFCFIYFLHTLVLKSATCRAERECVLHFNRFNKLSLSEAARLRRRVTVAVVVLAELKIVKRNNSYLQIRGETESGGTVG